MEYQNRILRLPLMPLREVVVFPKSVLSLVVGRNISIRAIEEASGNQDKRVFLLSQRRLDIDKPAQEDLYAVGVVARILQVLPMPDGNVKVLLEGLQRGVLSKLEIVSEDFGEALLESLEELEKKSVEGAAAIQVVLESLEEYKKLNKKTASEILQAVDGIQLPGRMADLIMAYLKTDYQRKQEVLEILDGQNRLLRVYELIQHDLIIANMEQTIKNRVKVQMEHNQREYYLNEQIKAIHKEMGREDDQQAELSELGKKLQAMNIPEEARQKGLNELKKLRQMPTSVSEYVVLRNYVDWILDLPWNNLKEIDLDLDESRRILDADHYGMDKAKERIMEYLAVQKLAGNIKGPILCLVGPPGVGKTSLAQSVARATGREFVRLSLGGVRDEAEIRGHRRTYVGALPGKILQSLKRAKYNNPLFCLDEIDKMSADFRGDPAAALLEVLDPEQNNAFNDHYLDLDYDLSRIFFITTANALHNMPPALLDRMEVIRLSGYLETEKRHIAHRHLLPKQVAANGLKPGNLVMSEPALLEIIRSHTKEAGVRGLEREIAAICRKIAFQVVEKGEPDTECRVGVNILPRLLGQKKFRYGEGENKPLVGVCNGLAYTETGGDILMVEVAIMPGQGKLSLTGKLGEVMTESARAALAYVRARSAGLGLRRDFYKDVDLHIHVPEGATPKDGPSAGITLATALVSALIGAPVRNDVAMTGEITLRGRLLPIGGLREKLLAARRAGIKIVILPAENEKDLKEVPEDILKGLTIHLVEHADEALALAVPAAGNLSGIMEDIDFCLGLKSGVAENILTQTQ